MEDGVGLFEKCVPFHGAYRTYELYCRIVQVGFYQFVEIVFVLDNACNQHFHAGLPGDLHCQVRSLVRVYPAEEHQLVAAFVAYCKV